MIVSVVMVKEEFVLLANEYINAILLHRVDLSDVQEYIKNTAFPNKGGDSMINQIRPSIYKSGETHTVQEMIDDLKDFDMKSTISVPAFVINYMRHDITNRYKEYYFTHVKWMVEKVNYNAIGGKRVDFKTLCEDFGYDEEWKAA